MSKRAVQSGKLLIGDTAGTDQLRVADDCDDCCGTPTCCGNTTGGPANGGGVDVTISWTDADTTKNFLNDNYTNGQTRYYCGVTGYTCNPTTTYYGGRERWTEQLGNDTIRLRAEGGTLFRDTVFVALSAGASHADNFVLNCTQSGGGSTSCATSRISSHNINPANLDGAKITSSAWFGSLTTVSGITVTWSQGCGGWGCN